MRWRAPLGVMIAALALTACGGSSSTSSATSTTTTSSSTQASSSTPTGTTTTSSSSTAASSTTSTGTTSSVSAPELPASFVIGPGGHLIPPGVGAPAHTDVALTLHNHDTRVHVVVLMTTPSHTLVVPARASRTLLLTHLKNGQYMIQVDRVNEGRLIVGITPGP